MFIYRLSHQGGPRTLGQASYPLSKGASRPRSQTGVSCTAGGFITTNLISVSKNCPILGISDKMEIYIQYVAFIYIFFFSLQSVFKLHLRCRTDTGIAVTVTRGDWSEGWP